MLKYVNTSIVFSEVPDELTLAVEISGCPIHCPACHSKHLWEDIGTELTNDELDKMLETPAITCICFMGGDQDLDSLKNIFKYCRSKDTSIKIAWYTGRDSISDCNFMDCLDYIKIGPYKEECGPINKKTTNQRMYSIKRFNSSLHITDITNKFWK